MVRQSETIGQSFRETLEDPYDFCDYCCAMNRKCLIPIYIDWVNGLSDNSKYLIFKQPNKPVFLFILYKIGIVQF